MTRVQQAAAAILFVVVLILGGWSWSQDSSPSDSNPRLLAADKSDVDKSDVDKSDVDKSDVDKSDVEKDDSALVPDALAPALAPALADALAPALADAPATRAASASIAESPRRQGVITNLTIFVLAVFLGIEVISKVPPTLHTPLMSGSNAISGIALVGAVIVASAVVDGFSPVAGVFARLLGFIAVTLAMINAVGGFMVTHRMLAMFTRK